MNLNNIVVRTLVYLLPTKNMKINFKTFIDRFFNNPYYYMMPLNIKEKLIIKKLKNKYSDKRCFIIGGAPSVKDLDLSKLNNEYTFIVNRGYLLKKYGLEKSTFHISTDLCFNTEFKDEIDIDFSETFISLKKATWTQNKNRIKISGKTWLTQDGTPFFQENAAKKLYLGQTVITSAIQLAYYMGFKEIILIGVDLSFSEIDDSHFYESSIRERKNSLSHSCVAKDHMSNWIEFSYNYLKSKNITLINASPYKDSLNFMDKVDFNSLFNKK